MSEGHEHTEEASAEAPAEQAIYFPPAEMMLQDLRNDYGQKCIENFELAAAARFQAGLLENFQAQMVELSTENSRFKSELAALRGEEPKPAESDI